jgi:predicted nucleic acid-binding Zn ribbon protein
VPQEDTRLDLWYPDSKRKMECVAAYSSLYPLMIYYLNRLNDWGLYFRKCKICGKVFLAKSQRYELCSDKCRKKQSLQNKREFDERARENNYDLLYKNECQNWRNKINKAKKTSGFPADRLEEMLAAFESFKKEALQRKQAVKKKTASPKEFSGWLLRQSNVIVKLAEPED